MTFTNLTNDPEQAVKVLHDMSVDEQLALLWFIFTDLSSQITAVSSHITSEFAAAVVEQIQQLPAAEQLRAQQDIMRGTDTALTRAYDALRFNARLDFWYRLAQGINQGTIVALPTDYQPSVKVQDFLSALKTLNFEQQMMFISCLVSTSSSEPKISSAG